MPISELSGWVTGWNEGNLGLAVAPPIRHEVGLLRGDPPAAQSWVFLFYFWSIFLVPGWSRFEDTEAGIVFLPFHYLVPLA